MIDLYSGTPGSGKSLHTAERICTALAMGRPVIANFEIVPPVKSPGLLRALRGSGKGDGHFTYIPNDEMTVDGLKQYARDYWGKKPVKEDTILLVIDEAQLVFNAREWAKAGRSDWLSFFTQHRKFGYHIILVAQFDLMIDKQIRSLIEYQYVHRKVSNFGLAGKVMSVFSLGKLFVAVKVWYPMKEKVGSDFFSAKKKYYSLYNTFAIMDETGENAAEENTL